MSKLGFVGLGIMGTPMAGRLLQGGHELFVYDIKPVNAELFAAGAVACASGKEVTQRAEVVIIMVPDTPHVAAALFGEAGVAEGLSADKIVIDMSSISPLETKEFARRIRDDRPLTPAEAEEGFAAFGTDDYREGIRAFLAKEKPRFTGR